MTHTHAPTRPATVAAIVFLVLMMATAACAGTDFIRHERGLPVNITAELLLEQNIIHVAADILLTRERITDGTVELYLNDAMVIKKAATADGTPVTYTQTGTSLVLDLSPFADSAEVVVSLEYESPQKEIPFLYVGQGNAYASWLTFWYPSTEDIDGLTGTNTFIAPAGFTVVSNGTLASHDSRDGKEIFTCRVADPTYLCFSAAHYHEYSKTFDGLEFKTFFTSDSRELSNYFIERAAPAVLFLREKYGIYPYDNFSLIEVPDLGGTPAGGFCEQGLVFLPFNETDTEYFNYPVILHEIGHLWWGNWVIGDEHIVSEGLANLSYLLYLEKLYGEEIMRRYLRYGSEDHFISLYLYQSQFLNEGTVEPKMVDDAFTMDQHYVSTMKGTMVFLMVRDLIGEDAFYAGLRKVLAEHVREQMPLKTLFDAWAEAGRTGLDEFYAQWAERSGIPGLSLEWSVAEDNGHYILSGSVTQTKQPYYTMPLELEIKTAGESAFIALNLSGEKTGFTITSPFKPTAVLLDPHHRALFNSPEVPVNPAFATSFGFGKSNAEKIEILKNLLAGEPGNNLARYWLAWRMPDTPEGMEEAGRLLEYIVENEAPGGELEIYYSRACMHLGNIYDQRCERDKAVLYYKKVLEVDRTGRWQALAKQYLESPYKRSGQ